MNARPLIAATAAIIATVSIFAQQPGGTRTNLQWHAANNVSSGNGAEVATYVIEKGKPLIMPVAVPSSKVKEIRP